MQCTKHRNGPAGPRSHAVMAAALALLASATVAQGPNVLCTHDGDSTFDEFGSAVSAAGDVNLDGYSDFVVGAYLDDNNGQDSGSARVFSGKTGEEIYTFYGDSPGDLFGWAVGAAGDVNSDGYADVIVGARKDDDNGSNAGSARVFSGLDGSTLYTFHGDAAGDLFGTSVDGAGDVNGDGVDDVIVGARGAAPNGKSGAGMARVFSGSDGQIVWTFYGDTANDEFGHSVSGAGDLDGDGRAELVVGAPQDVSNGRGFARVFDGATGQVLTTLWGDQGGDELGTSVNDAGDVDKDTVPDIIVGAPEANDFGDDSGLVRVYSGVDFRVLLTFWGDNAYDFFGKSVDGAGDVNFDGHADLVVGSPLNDQFRINTGSVFVFSGFDGSELHHWWGDSQSDWLGHSVAGAGNVNGLGAPEVIAGAPLDDNNGLSSGSSRVFCGDGPAMTTTFGEGCPASKPLTLAYGGSSQIGGTLLIQISNGPPASTVCAVFFGEAGGASFPVDFTSIGMPGCSQYHPMLANVSVLLTGGSATLNVPIPNVPTLCGGEFLNQSFAVDASANALGVSASNAGQVIVGS